MCAALSIAADKRLLYVSIPHQRLFLFEGLSETPAREFICSTSEATPSVRENSYGTPPGLHTVAAKIGLDEAAGTVFKARVPVAGHWKNLPAHEQAHNLITSRILRLRGAEPANSESPHNAWDRYVYIHGTNRAERLGTPASAGCVLLSDADVIELFDRVDPGDLVWIDAG